MRVFQHHEEHIDDGLILLQANIDDMNPEHCPYVMDKLFELGANDVYWIPIIMKKGRSGLMLNVLVDMERIEQVKELVFKETTTLGLRYAPVTCHRLGRALVNVVTPWGEVPVKIGYYQGKEVQYAPEFSDCRRIAHEHSIPLKHVYDTVRSLYLAQRSVLG